MDQNTTTVPKLWQLVKGIEARFVKIHRCNIFVHGVELYTDVQVNSYHRHDSNQVITFIMNVIGYVIIHLGNKLPPILCI